MYDLFWAGMLTVGNVEAVADLFRQLLAGKRFTVVTSNEMFRFEPEVQTGEQLAKEGIIVYHYDEDHVGIGISSSRALYPIHSSAKNENLRDRKGDDAFIAFSGSQVKIIHTAGAGNLLHWVFAVEPASRQKEESAQAVGAGTE